VDIAARAAIHEIIRDLAAQGVAILLVSSDLPELLGLCDRILVMCEGRLAGERRAAEVTQERIMHLASGGADGSGGRGSGAAGPPAGEDA
jgi:ribose transport system ATP-binding protein